MRLGVIAAGVLASSLSYATTLDNEGDHALVQCERMYEQHANTSLLQKCRENVPLAKEEIKDLQKEPLYIDHEVKGWILKLPESREQCLEGTRRGYRFMSEKLNKYTERFYRLERDNPSIRFFPSYKESQQNILQAISNGFMVMSNHECSYK